MIPDSIAKRSWIPAAIIACIVGLLQLPAGAQQPSSQIDVSSLRIPGGAAITAAPPTGAIDLWINLADPSLGRANGRNAKRRGALLSRAQQGEYSRGLTSKQDALIEQVQRLGGREIARVRKAHNAVAVRIDASQIDAISALPGVLAVRPIRDYRMHLSSTVPYIGAAAVQAAGVDGTGVTVAVIDSGIDYTHRNLGGSGLVADYVSAYGTSPADPRNTSRDGLFPTAKVIDGYDFVGEQWPNGPRAPDDDPIDFEGHGTHVADIIAGHSVDDAHKGVAPGASLLAIKVCSSVSTACSGVALLQALDFALDPNGDDDLSDAADVINMSLGLSYGQKEDDLGEASQVAVEFGVVVVASAGNDGDRPYIVGTPSSAPGVISVAETHVPTAAAIPLVIDAPANIAGRYPNTATLDFAPVSVATSGIVAFVGRGCPAGSIGPTEPADPYLDNPAGKIALIDRGACNISLKIDRAARAGAIGVLIGLVAPGDATSFSFGGGTMFVPSLVITQETSDRIKANLGAPVRVTISPAFSIPLVASVVGSSARGPSYSYNAIKPDIAAPGASVSAVAGSGTGEEAFGGTSGAAPMVSGSAALLLQANPHHEPVEIKSLLMNTAETNVQTNPARLPGVLAPVTRIGGGEVRVDRALASTTAAWDSEADTGGLSFGYEAVPHPTALTRRVTVENLSNKGRTYAITPRFRYANDAASGAVDISAPSSIHVPAHKRGSFSVLLRINPIKLPVWTLNGGILGGTGSLLQNVEFDGYISIADRDDNVHVAWHVLPHRAASVTPARDKVKLVHETGNLVLTNDGAVAGRVEVFSLTGTSRRIRKKELPQPGDNFAIVDLEAVGVRPATAGGTPAIQFGITTRGERSHPNYPAEFDVYIDANRDSEFDYVIFNSENGGFAASGQNVVSVLNLHTNALVTRFFADADLDSANFIATALLSDLGLTPNATFDFSVFAFDNYFTGDLTDAIEGMTYTLALPRFTTFASSTMVPVGGTSVLTVQEADGGDAASPSQTGLLLLYRDGAQKKEADLISVR
jgi:subtilisin family serine protease